MTRRVILHLDLDAFFCAVEENRDPALRGIPFAVGGQPDQRGVVASCSYAARVYGVRSAMPMSQAVRLCPDLVIVGSQHGEYGKVSKQVMAILNDTTPYVEQLSIDEAFMDVSVLKGTGESIAKQLQKRIWDELNLPCSLGVATNKLLAKIANNQGKARMKSDKPPRAIEIVPNGMEAKYLAPLPIRDLWGVGKKTADRLHSMGVHTIGDVAIMPQQNLMHHFGKLGEDIWRRAQGIDNRDVISEHEAKSISNETTFVKDVSDQRILLGTIRKLSDSVGRRLRKSNLKGTTIKIKVRWADFTTLTRQVTLHSPTDLDDEIFEEAKMLFDAVWTGRSIRLLGVGVTNFSDVGRQMSLFDEKENEKEQTLQNTIDELRNRFGQDSLKRGSHLDVED